MNLHETRSLNSAAKNHSYEWESEDEANESELNSLGYSIITFFGGLLCFVVGIVALILS